MKQFVFVLLFIGSIAGQSDTTASATAASKPAAVRSLPEFDYTDGWLGADDAYSIPLTSTESLWLFGDTFVGTRETKLRNQAITMVHNSVGISKCEQGKSCTLSYFWHDADSPKPRSFFDTGTDLYYWPLYGFLAGKTLYLSLLAVRNKTGANLGDPFGFEIAGPKRVQ